MAVLSAELVQRLARHRGGDHCVVSLYLNVDGKQNIRPEDYELHLDVLIKEAAGKHPQPDVAVVLDRMRAFVVDDFDRGSSRGLAVFCSAGIDDLWEVVPLPIPVPNHLVVNASPHVRELETILDGYETTAILLTDRQRCRLMLVELGAVVERDELIDPLPRHDDDKGDWDKDHVRTHVSVAAQHHLRHAARATFELFQRRPFAHLVLCCADELAGELERQLHAYLRARLAGRCSLPMTVSEDDAVAVAQEFVRKANRVKESVAVDRLRAAVASNGAARRSDGDSVGGVAGLAHTLKAVFERRVDTLLVSEGFAQEGWRCKECSFIATVGRSCPMCQAEMTLVEDVVEEAVEDALSQSCRVEFCAGNADLDVLGRIGALLRF